MLALLNLLLIELATDNQCGPMITTSQGFIQKFLVGEEGGVALSPTVLPIKN